MNSEDKNRDGLLFLVIFCGVVYLILSYLEIVVVSIGCILTLVISYWLISFLLRRRKIRRIQESDVISIPSQADFSIPLEVEKHEYETDEGKIKSRWMVMSLRPELDDSNLDFVKLNYELGKVKVLRSEPKQDANYEITKQISSLTKEIFNEINPQLSELKQQDAELGRLEKLVASSELHHSKAHLYQRARKQLQQLINQAENLKGEYGKCIREILIGAEISQFDPTSIPDILERKLTLHSKYKTFKIDFQNKKDEIAAYDDLRIEMSQLP